jgi:hypothetical protein
MSPSIIETATLRVVAQCVNQLRHCVPQHPYNSEIKSVTYRRTKDGDFEKQIHKKIKTLNKLLQLLPARHYDFCRYMSAQIKCL